jgi:exodeoxyribonuclease-3
MQLATWNVNSLTVRLPQVIDWLALNPVDVLGLQELKTTDDKFPVQAFLDRGYQSFFFGQKTYNGVALLVKNGTQIDELNIIKNIPNFSDEQARVISASVATSRGEVRVVNAYFVNGNAPGTEKFDYKMRWLKALESYLQQELKRYPQMVLMGDFNITWDDADSYDPEGLRDTIHHTTEERDRLKALLAIGFVDAHRLMQPDVSSIKAEKKFTWWDYRDFGFRRNRGLRIDYVLASEALKAAVVACHIDKTPRSNERPSDHTPVILTLD